MEEKEKLGNVKIITIPKYKKEYWKVKRRKIKNGKK
jgi:hypothetical protein